MGRGADADFPRRHVGFVDDLAAGRLVPLCPGWTTEAVPLFLVAPSRRQFTPLVRALRDFVAGRLQALMERAPR